VPFLDKSKQQMPSSVKTKCQIWQLDMTQEGGEGPEATFLILVFTQDVWKPIVFAAVSNDSWMDDH